MLFFSARATPSVIWSLGHARMERRNVCHGNQCGEKRSIIGYLSEFIDRFRERDWYIFYRPPGQKPDADADLTIEAFRFGEASRDYDSDSVLPFWTLRFSGLFGGVLHILSFISTTSLLEGGQIEAEVEAELLNTSNAVFTSLWNSTRVVKKPKPTLTANSRYPLL